MKSLKRLLSENFFLEKEPFLAEICSLIKECWSSEAHARIPGKK